MESRRSSIKTKSVTLPDAQPGTKKRGRNPIPFWRRIRFKLITSFLIPVLFIIILGVVSYQKASTQIIASYETSADQTIDMINQYLTLVFDTVQSNYKSYLNEDSLLQFFKGLMDGDNVKHAFVPKDYRDKFSHAVTTDALVSNIYFLSDTQQSIVTSQAAEEKLLTAYIQTHQGEMVKNDQYKFYLFGNQCPVDGQLSTDSGKYGARLARYVNNAGAIMIVDIDRNVIDDALSSLDAGPGSIVGFLTCDGGEYLSSLSEEAEGPVFAGKPYVEEAFAGEEGNGFSYVEDNKYLFLYSRLEGRDALICALVPRETIIGQTVDIQRFSMALVVLASLIAVLLGSMLARQYGGAIYDMIHKLKKISEGDLTVEVKTRRKDEFKLLAEGVTDMATHMKTLVTGLKDVNAELTGAVGGMTAASDSFLTSSRGIQTEISDMKQGIGKMDNESEDCMRQMDALSLRIGQVAENSGQINVLAKGAEQVIETGMDSVVRLKDSTGATITITSNIIDVIDNLEEKSRSIGMIIETINEIAEQTTLLSLNASIEAARAGNAGRGFAVVAMEIKKLADESIQSASQIARIVEEIEKNTKEASTVARQAEGIVDGQQQAVSLTTDSFDRIGRQVSELLDALGIINESVANMEEDRNATLTAISAISAVSAQTAAGSENVYTTAREQLKAVEELDKAAEILEKRAGELSGLLEVFRV
ncbi:methyl-accepting chemotaxis protein McpC [Lachnospiraceae bacterium]|nr:methyl-accepting chemotaxis protein McpC [Lachnospiraceae bacterium]